VYARIVVTTDLTYNYRITRIKSVQYHPMSESYFDSNPHTLQYHISESESLARLYQYNLPTCESLEHLPSINVPDQTKNPQI
jgi:hypothetical protein